MTPSCPFSNTCLKFDCGKKHHTSLHEYFTERGEPRKPGNRRQRQKADTKIVVAAMKPTNFSDLSSAHQLKDAFPPTVPLILYGNEGTCMKTYGLLDECSVSTFIREEVANKLKLCTVNRCDALTVREVSLHVSSRDGSRTFDVHSAHVRPSSYFTMPAKPNFIDSPDASKHLEGIEPDAVNSNNISILIGADVPDALLKKGFLFDSKDQPLVVDTPFGWTPSLYQARRSLWKEKVKEHGGSVQLFTNDDDRSSQESVETMTDGDYTRPVSNLHKLEDNLDDC